MRLLNLWVEDWKNLRNIYIEFDSTQPSAVVVGRNGTGKSNLIEALVIIFRDLDLNRKTDFGYKIEYLIRGSRVEVENRLDRKTRRTVRLNGKRASASDLRGRAGLLPDFVFGYYSGPSNRLEKHFLTHQNTFNRALREGEDRPLRRFFYARPEHSQFVLLAFFLAKGEGSVVELLDKYLRIEKFESALFVAATPPWKTRVPGNPRFWNARGAVADLLDELYRLSTAPMRLSVNTVRAGSRWSGEHVYLFLEDLQKLEALAMRYGGSASRLFAAFESILAADLLSELRVRVKARGVNGSVTFRELSEGEQQLLMVLGLLRFTRSDESLFLLDEPDTHLNPVWSLHYIDMIKEHSGKGLSTSQVVMASHDPLVIASLLASQVCLLERDAESGVVTATRPATDPRGMGVSALLTSEVYGLASELDPATYRKLERRRWLAASDDLSPEEMEELARLTAELEDLDFTLSDRDPLYTRFEKAMASVDRSDTPVMTPQATREEEARGLQRLREILADEDPDH